MPKSLPVLALVVCASGVVAQVADSTTLVGTVHDRSGALLPNTHVRAVNQETKVEYDGTSNEHGDYAIQFVAPGTYDITAEDPGFQQVTQRGVLVVVNQSARADFDLPVGETSSTVTISADTPPMPTDDASLGETFLADTVVDVPLLGHNALEVATLASNVTIGGKSSYTGVPPGEDFIGAGQREVQNSLSLDGVSIMNNLLSSAPARPSADMVSEVQMQSGNYPAQYGSYLGLHINMVSKSGTNDLHGAVYDYLQNTALNAKGFSVAAGVPKQVQHYNQYGFDLGGPVRIPHLYNGRDRTFFFASWERLRQVQENPTITSTLTAAERAGDFSALGAVDASGNCPTGEICLQDPGTGAYYPNNQIPAALLSTPAAQISQKLQAYMPLPNVPASAANTQNGTQNNLNVNVPSSLVITQTLDRLDENIGDKVRLFFRVHWQDITNFSGDAFPTNATYGPTDSRNYAFGYTHTITSNFINDFRIGLNTITSNALNYFAVNGPVDAGSSLGIPGFNSDTQYHSPGIPTITIDTLEGLGNTSTNWFQDDRTVDGYDEVSWTHGRHNLMAGAELRRLTLGRVAANDDRGIIDFYASASAPGTPGTSTGYGAADFVVGLSQDSTTPILPVKGSVGEWRDGFFVLDNWQPIQRLTLNYGIRYELPTVPYSLNGYARLLNSSETALIPSTNAGLAADFTPTPGFKFIAPTHNLWAPRLGFALRPTDKSTLRGGFGIYYNANQLNTYTLTDQNYPLSNTVSYYTDPSSLLTFSNPTPNGASLNPVAGVPGTYVSAITVQPNLPVQRSYQWNLSAGQELWTGAALELQYLGSHSFHLDRNFFDNTPTPGPGDVNARRPNQLFGQIRKIENDAYSHYNGFTAILRQRSNHGLTTLLSYTWSHDMDITDDSNGTGNTQNNYDIRADYGDSGWDIRNRFSGTVLYELPKLQGSNHLLRGVLGGWQTNAIVQLQGGTPLNFTVSYDPANVGNPRNVVQRANQIRPLRAFHCSTRDIITGAFCVDAGAFAPPASYTFGDAHRNVTHGPGFENVNFSVFKNFPIVERLQLQFRAEAANVFNHPNVSYPDTDIASPSFNPTNPSDLNNQGFGLVTGSQNNARELQLAAKVIF